MSHEVPSVTSPRPSSQPSSRRLRSVLVAGVIVALGIGGVALAMGLGGSDSEGRGVDADGTAKGAVLGALRATVAAGTYDMAFTLHATPATRPPKQVPCPPMIVEPDGTQRKIDVPGSCSENAGIRAAVDVTGHGTVNVAPYAMTAVTTVSGLGLVTVFANGTSVWEVGGGNYGTSGPSGGAPGASLPGFASLVEGTLGAGQGALTMIGIANPTGYLNLEEEAVVGASAAGSGAVDGEPVTYYDVTIDVVKMADAPDLTDEQRSTIRDASKVLTDAGYSGTTQRIGIDGAGFIREITATSRFADGSILTRHTVLSNFGCAARVTMPNEPPAPPPTTPCVSPDSTTTSTSEATTTTSLATDSSSTTTSTTPLATTLPGSSTTTSL